MGTGGGTAANFWSVSVGSSLMATGTSTNSWATDYSTFTCGSTLASNLLTITVRSGASRTTTVNFDNFLALPLALAW